MKASEHILTGMEAAPWKTGERAARPEQGCPLQVAEVPPGLHEKAEGIIDRHAIYRLSWRQPGHGRRSGAYVKLTPAQLRLPDEAARILREASAARHIEETAVFLSTRLGGSRIELILAARGDGHWSALHRWADTWRHAGLSRLEVCVS
jgi:hypothetical protein